MASPSSTAIISRKLKLNPFHLTPKFITTFSFRPQEAQLATEQPPLALSPLPLNPATDSPLYNKKWRKLTSISTSASLNPSGFVNSSSKIEALALTLAMMQS
ncbi:hypothetical protein Tco_0303899 [Tanacetum coccineum]